MSKRAPTFESQVASASDSAARRREELHEKLAQLNSRYVVGEKQETGGSSAKVGLAAIQDLAARQEASLAAASPDTTPTNELGMLRYDPFNNKMTLELEPQAPDVQPQR